MDNENLGAADRIVQAALAYTDHMVHNRPGVVVPDGRTNIGVRWDYATHKVEGQEKVAYRLVRQGKRTEKVRVGVVAQDGRIMDGARAVGEYRQAGLFPEVAAWLYRQVADVWRLDNEFAARWGSHAFAQEHRDLKVVLAAFLLVQGRKGDPVVEDGKVAFRDDDYRDVGEAMMLLRRKDGRDLNPKLLLRVRDVLRLPAVAAINRELGFGRSARGAFLGRWPKAVEKWLRHREENPKLLEGLVRAGFRTTVMALASAVGYRPEGTRFFEILRWKQTQSEDGRRSLAIGASAPAAETWEGLTEAQICERVMRDKPGYKRLVGLVPKSVGLTRAVFAAAVESGALSDKDLVIATPTIEDLGLMDVQSVRERWDRAVRAAEDMRAANVAARVRGREAKEALAAAAEGAAKKATEEVMRGLRVYVMVDRSGSMHGSIQAAIGLVTKLLPAFPEDRLHVAYFNTAGREVSFKAHTAAGVAQAFRGVSADGGTDYGAGVKALADHKPKDDEDTLMIFVGDQEANAFSQAVRASGLRPMAFGFLHVPGGHGHAVEQTATELGIPCFRIDDRTFDDTYAIPRTIRALVAATPVGQSPAGVPRQRQSLAEAILATDLLKKPAWA